MVARLQELTGVALPEAGVSTRALCALSRVDVDGALAPPIRVRTQPDRPRC